MTVIQIGANQGNDELTELLKNQPIDKLILVEPLELHNVKLKQCYSNIENLFIENIALTDDPNQKEIKSLRDLTTLTNNNSCSPGGSCC